MSVPLVLRQPRNAASVQLRPMTPIVSSMACQVALCFFLWYSVVLFLEVHLLRDVHHHMEGAN
jgi:hypothetical protein